jgi:ABC-type multidrug transport system ATPase subunit
LPDVSEASVEVRNLTKTYGAVTALADVSLTVRDGEVLGLIGPNGAGKTTLFECLGGQLPADRGEILRAGRPLSARERTDTLFYVPDGIAPWPSETVGWSLDFAAGYFGAGPERRQHAVSELQLGPLLGTRIGALSKGQRKRAVLAIGWLTPQPVLLVDEPFDGLDLRQTREVGDALRRHAGTGRTLFLSIHQIGDAARMCDRFVLLSGGCVRGQGTADDLRTQAASLGDTTVQNLEEAVLALT